MTKRLLAAAVAALTVGFGFAGVANAAPEGSSISASPQNVWHYEGTFLSWVDCHNAGVSWVAVQGATSWACTERPDAAWDLYVLD
jgi:hypothetical protein